MRIPEISFDGWGLDDGEELHLEAPETFWIPDLELRQILQKGDLAKLVFKISIGGEHDAVERMWVIVRERSQTGYIGMLHNEPYAISENDRLWLGTEFAFEYRHIVQVEHATAETLVLASAPAPIPWKNS